MFCPPGYVLKEIVNGQPVCQKIGTDCSDPANCPAGMTYGLVSAIPPVCRPFPSAATGGECKAPASLKWKDGSLNCQAAGGMTIPNNGTVTVVDNVSDPAFGDATYICKNGKIKVQSSNCMKAGPSTCAATDAYAAPCTGTQDGKILPADNCCSGFMLCGQDPANPTQFRGLCQ